MHLPIHTVIQLANPVAAEQSSNFDCKIVAGARRGWFEVVFFPQFPETADLLGFLCTTELKLFQHLVESVPRRTLAALRATTQALPGIGGCTSLLLKASVFVYCNCVIFVLYSIAFVKHFVTLCYIKEKIYTLLLYS